MASSDDQPVTSSRCLYVYGLKGWTKKQVHDTIQQFISKLHKPLSSTTFRTNLPQTPSGELREFGYIFFESSKVAALAVGKNEDGSDRIEYRDDPDYVEEPDEVIKTKSWADLADVPQIKVHLDPLYEQPYKIDKNGEKEYLLMRFCIAYAPGPNYQHHILRCCSPPDSITEADIKNVFSYYTYSSVYPIITIKKIKDERNILVRFDQNSNDALFALCMTKVVEIKKHVLKFSYDSKFRHHKQ